MKGKGDKETTPEIEHYTTHEHYVHYSVNMLTWIIAFLGIQRVDDGVLFFLGGPTASQTLLTTMPPSSTPTYMTTISKPSTLGGLAAAGVQSQLLNTSRESDTGEWVEVMMVSGHHPLVQPFLAAWVALG